MTYETGRRPFSELGDQQLLDQTKRLAANQRCIEVHILDHLDEIDRRGLALRRGFSSLFDYAVRELRFTDAAAQRRIQAMRLCRRHGWVRASLQSGELSLTGAAQLETTFAGAERAERQCRTGRRNVGHGRCHDQEKDDDPSGRTEQLGLPAAPGEAGEQGERGPQSAPGRAPRAEQCSGDAAAVNTPVVPVASHAVAQDPGAGHAGAPLPRPELSGNATAGGPRQPPSNTGSSRTAKVWPEMGNASPLCAPVSAAPSSDEGPAPQLLPPTHLPAHAPVPVPVAAPSEALRVASRVPDSSRDDSFAELSPGPLSAAPLLHPQRQRELIEQAAGMSTRQVAVLLAAAAPEVVPPRDTLRAVAPDRYTLKATIDQECEQGLRRLKVCCRTSTRACREATWWRAWCARRWRGTTRSAAVAASGGEARAARAHHRGGRRRRHVLPGQRPGRLSAYTNPRGGRRTGHVPPRRRRPRLGAEAAILRRRRVTAPLLKGGTRSRCWPTLFHRGSQRPLHWQMAPAQVALHRARPMLLRRGSQRPAPRRMAPMPALPCRSRRSALRRRSLYSACPLTADRATHQPGQRRTRPAILSTTPTNPRRGATFLRLFGVTSGNATEGAVAIAIRSPGAAAPLPICCRSTTCCRSPRAVARTRTTWLSNAEPGVMRSDGGEWLI